MWMRASRKGVKDVPISAQGLPAYGGPARHPLGGFTSLWLVYPPFFLSAVFVADWRVYPPCFGRGVLGKSGCCEEESNQSQVV